jgi:phosphoglycerate dehydrogenase-like enzyme
VNESALVEALEGRDRGAGVDVFTRNRCRNHPLTKLDTVLTPHMYDRSRLRGARGDAATRFLAHPDGPRKPDIRWRRTS